MPSKYADVKGYATYYHYAGLTTLPDVAPDFSRGRKLVCIHGAGLNGHVWHRQITAIGEKHSPVALDLPGHGRSSGVEGLSTISDYSDFIVAFLDALKIKSAVIAGRSMGAAIAMDLALRHQDRVEALVLIAPQARFNIAANRIENLRAVTMGRAPQAFTTDGYSQKTLKENFDLVREGWMEQIKTDPRVRYTDILACARVDLSDVIAKIDKPTLVIAGAEDPITPLSDAESIKSKIAGAHLQVIPDASHNVANERPDEVNAAIEKFLAELKQERR
ncbi:MAG TPA: alpha/beta hydrolase [Candidatus Binataceae bacterium]